MPHFDTVTGEDKVLCQVCANVVLGSKVTWRPDIARNQTAASVCATCIEDAEYKAWWKGFNDEESGRVEKNNTFLRGSKLWVLYEEGWEADQ
jgi:hypothetical protein